MATLVKKQALDTKQTRFISFGGSSIPDLSMYRGEAVSLCNEISFYIGDEIIYAWSRWFIPRVEDTDFMGFIVYPDSTKFWILGHTKWGYYVKRVY